MAGGPRATMDFFAAQSTARRRTWVLVFWFLAAWAGTIVAVWAGLGVVLRVTAADPAARDLAFTPAFLAIVAVFVSLVTGAGSAFHAVRLSREGGHAVARMVGGVQAERATRDPAERRLVNVVEEMSIASGVPVPAIYVLPEEQGINAFAAGLVPERGVVAVTRGAVERLSRDELQGVVAHEFSHLLNADARLNLRLVAVIGGITVLALAGRFLLRLDGGHGRRTRWRSPGGGRGRAVAFLVGLCLWVTGSIGAFFGRVIRAAVSRQREFLADAAAVQFTRNPEGLGGALAKVAAQGSAISSPQAPEVSHFFFANGLVSGWLATHPPVEERIRRLVPQGLARVLRARAEGTGAPAAPAGEVPVAAAALAPPAPPAEAPGPAAALSASAGRPEARHVGWAADLLAHLPPEVAAAAREPRAARALACALLADPAPAAREAQLARIGDAAVRADAGRLAASLAGVTRQARMAILDLALPSLDSLSREDASALALDAAALAAADGRTTVHEWAVLRILRRRLVPVRGGTKPAAARARGLDDVQVEAHALLSILAWLGSRDEAGAQAAIDAGAKALGVSRWRPLPRERVRAALLDSALERLDGAAPALQRRLLAACTATVLADGRVLPAEAEVVRAVAASIGVPMPPLVEPPPAEAAGRAGTG